MFNCPIKTIAGVTGWLPIHARSITFVKKIQNAVEYSISCFNSGALKLYCPRVVTRLNFGHIFVKGNSSKIPIDAAINTTPPNLSGIDRKIA